jgi:3-deoxy-manno-octulosonate cytidylyltransferase (CMP-KDO synthetase)|tara:strand:- start:5733 stop:6464 length:732 start_codon:yes stop_codon:yes gene_type:complete
MILGLIPARLNSQRLPGKPLIEIDGLPLIIHVLKRSLLCKKLDKVIVCADDKSIISVVEKFGGEAILTSKKHSNGTERICEIAKKFKAQLVIDIQCDEVFLKPNHLDKLVDFHKKNKNFDIVIPHSQLFKYNNKNIVKIIDNGKGKIIYLSRADTPFYFRKKQSFLKKHLDFISFKKESLLNYCKLKKSKNEKIESVELLRAIDNNFNLGTIKINTDIFSINTQLDLEKAKIIMKKCKIRKKY